MAYTLDEFLKLNKNYTKSYDPLTKKATLSNTKTGKSIGFTSGQGQQYGLGGIENGSNTITDLDKLTSYLEDTPSKSSTSGVSGTPSYTSPYSQNILDTLETIQNSKFKYNPEKDTALQNAQGEAMDAVSRAAARRGMLYSDSNKAQMGEASADLVPQYEELAYNKYADNLNNLRSQLSTYQNLDTTEYNRSQDSLSNYASTADQFSSDFKAEMDNIQAMIDAGQTYDPNTGLLLQDELNILGSKRAGKVTGLATTAAEQEQQDLENQMKLAQLNYNINKPYYKPESGTSDETMTKDEAYANDYANVENGLVAPEEIEANKTSLRAQYGIAKYNALLELAQTNYNRARANGMLQDVGVADFRILAGEQ